MMRAVSDFQKEQDRVKKRAPDAEQSLKKIVFVNIDEETHYHFLNEL
jgi:hypothetical protein